ncbi:MAG: hypothetical protein HC896_19015, partial [Bacteroidales bacterium]|nr:hypothetical protein [Bacteroidales bacterium]
GDTELDMPYPLALCKDNANNLVVTSYNRLSNESVVTKYTKDLNKAWSINIKINLERDDFQKDVLDPFLKREMYLPIITRHATIEGKPCYMVNAVNAYTLSLHFLDAQSGALQAK